MANRNIIYDADDYIIRECFQEMEDERAEREENERLRLQSCDIELSDVVNDFYYEDREDEVTWGRANGACDGSDNCYGCPYADECFG